MAETHTYTRSSCSSKLACAMAAAVAILAGTQARAQSGVLVEAGNERLRQDLQWLADHGVIQLSTWSWPMPLAAIDAALAARRPNLTSADRDALADVEIELARQRVALGGGAALRGNTASLPAMGFDAPVRADAEASAWIEGTRGPLAGRLQLRGLYQPLTSRQSNGNLEGSYIAGNVGGQVLYAGQLAHWWGPGQEGSLIWSNAGLAIPGIGLKRGQERPFETRWLSWLGPWSYELFLGQMLHNQFASGTKVFSMRFQAEPLPRFQLGFSRLIQWGGSVGGDGLDALGDAILGRSNDPNGAVNNEIAGFDLRYTWLPGGNPLTLYGQFIGEDEASKAPTEYLSLVGLQFKHTLAAARFHWYLEAADTMSNRFFGLKDGTPGIAYRHSQFLDGMYHEGLPIGHFIGGDGRSNSIGVSVAPMQNAYRLRYGARFMRAEVNPGNQTVNLAFPAADTVKLAELTASWYARVLSVRAVKMNLGLSFLDSRNTGRDTGLKFGVEVPL